MIFSGCFSTFIRSFGRQLADTCPVAQVRSDWVLKTRGASTDAQEMLPEQKHQKRACWETFREAPQLSDQGVSYFARHQYLTMRSIYE